MDSEIDGGRCPHHAMMVLCCAVLPASRREKEVVVCWRGFTSHDLSCVDQSSVDKCNTMQYFGALHNSAGQLRSGLCSAEQYTEV